VPREKYKWPPGTRVIASIMIGVALLSMAVRCGPIELVPQPEVPRPEVVWPDGQPAGPLESDPWVQTVRTSYLEMDVAITTRDFRSQALRDTTAPRIRRETRDYLEDAARDKAWVFTPGPRPMVPIHVDVAPDYRSATVITCNAADWYVTAEHPDAPIDPLGTLLEIRVTFEDVHRRVDGAERLDEDVVMNGMGPRVAEATKPFLDPREESACLLDDAALGYFVPQPDVGLEYTPDDIK
jgi:hypothetical protein